MVSKTHLGAKQRFSRLAQSASLAADGGEPVSHALSAGCTRPSLAQRAAHVVASAGASTAKPSCQQRLTFSFFFDGTGNNYAADVGTDEHSNVARMYAAHKRDDETLGRYRIYVPGIGTHFPEINDPGGTLQGLGLGDRGKDRIDWAFNQFRERLAYHVALAQNPRNKITMIRVCAFGFSRGATQARAFAREFQELCTPESSEWRLQDGGYPVRFYFLGLWDTVASVGIPMSANTTPLAQSLRWMKTATVLHHRNTTDTGVRKLAFGQPGADPAPGPNDGHMGWANNIEIPEMVEQCIHMVAAHEIRNSFPLDSCLREWRYPSGVEEMVYPGAHSDVGGGYRPGEGARSSVPGQMLSLISLRTMHQRALTVGVPLHMASVFAEVDPKLPFYFGMDESSQPEFTKMNSLWMHYMQTAGMGGRPVGAMINAHMRYYYGWRFYKIKVNAAARALNIDTVDETALKKSEVEWRKEKAALEREMNPAEEIMVRANRVRDRARGNLQIAWQRELEYGVPIDPTLKRAAEAADAHATEATGEYLRLKARYDTLPGTEGAMASNLRMYDEQLMTDAQAIRIEHLAQPHQPIRPHYRNLLEAYEAEFIHNAGLRDERIIEFFDTYVHDSLAGFAWDATLPSDPRVVYVGGNIKSKHSKLHPSLNERDPIPA